MTILCTLSVGLLLFVALWLGYHEHKLRNDHAKGDSCKKLKLGQENPLWDADVEAALPGLDKVLARLMEKRAQGKLDDPHPQGRFKRAQHPVAWGCAPASLEILSVKESDRYGIFARPGEYKALVRTSKNAFTPDALPKLPSVALKIFGVNGTRLPLDQHDQSIRDANKDTLDFIMVANPTLPLFVVPIELTILHEWLVWGNLPGAVLYMLAFRPTLIPRVAIMLLKGWPASNPFLVRNYVVQSNQLGPNQAMRVGLFPCDESEAPYFPPPKVEFVHHVAQSYLDKKDVCMKLMIQKQTDPCNDQVDDIIHQWSGPWQHVGTMRIRKGTQLDMSNEGCDNLSFNPFHAVEDNRPLGWVAKVRKEVYRMGSDLRLEKNRGNTIEKEISKVEVA